MKILLSVLLFCSVPAVAQTFPLPVGQTPTLKEFLQLTSSQEQTILRNNSAYTEWHIQKNLRMSAVQLEIAVETSREVLDANAIGVRYVEIESICREISDRWIGLKTSNTDVLTQEQKAKLKVLEEAVRLAPVIQQAQIENLLAGEATRPGFYGFVLAGSPAGMNGCNAVPSLALIGGFIPGVPPRVSAGPQR